MVPGAGPGTPLHEDPALPCWATHGGQRFRQAAILELLRDVGGVLLTPMIADAFDVPFAFTKSSLVALKYWGLIDEVAYGAWRITEAGRAVLTDDRSDLREAA